MRVRARFDAIVVKTKCRPCCQVSKEPGNELVEALRTSYIQSGAGGGGENWGPWKVKRRVDGSSLIKVRNFHLPYFSIVFEGGSWIVLNDRRDYPKKHECYQIWKFFCMKNIFLHPLSPSDINNDWSLKAQHERPCVRKQINHAWRYVLKDSIESRSRVRIWLLFSFPRSPNFLWKWTQWLGTTRGNEVIAMPGWVPRCCKTFKIYYISIFDEVFKRLTKLK